MKLSDTGIGDVEVTTTKKERWDALDFDTKQAIIDIAESTKAIIDLGYAKASAYLRAKELNVEELTACWDQFGSCDRSALKRAKI